MHFLILFFLFSPAFIFPQNDALHRIREEIVTEINQLQLRADGLFTALVIVEREIEFDKMKPHEQE